MCQVLRGQGGVKVVVKVGMSSSGLKVGGQVWGRVKVRGQGEGSGGGRVYWG